MIRFMWLDTHRQIVNWATLGLVWCLLTRERGSPFQRRSLPFIGCRHWKRTKINIKHEFMSRSITVDETTTTERGALKLSWRAVTHRKLTPILHRRRPTFLTSCLARERNIFSFNRVDKEPLFFSFEKENLMSMRATFPAGVKLRATQHSLWASNHLVNGHLKMSQIAETIANIEKAKILSKFFFLAFYSHD